MWNRDTGFPGKIDVCIPDARRRQPAATLVGMATPSSRVDTTNMNCARSGRDCCLTLIAIFFTTFASAFHANNEVLEYWDPSACKQHNEYFDAVSLSCSRCNASRNLEPAADRGFMSSFYSHASLSASSVRRSRVCFSQVCDVGATGLARQSAWRTAVRFAPRVVPR